MFGISHRTDSQAAAKLEALDRSQAVIEFDMDGKVLTANGKFLELMGYELAEIIGKPHRLFMTEAEAASEDYGAFWAALRAGRYHVAQFKRRTKDGRTVWIEASYNPVLDRNGKPCRVVKFATDITARKLREADFQGQIEAIRTSQAVIEFDMRGHVLWANDKFLATTGYRLDEIVGQHHRLFVDPAYARSAEYAAFWETLQRGEYSAGRFCRRGRDGRQIWLEASYNPIFDPEGKPTKVVKFASDITQRQAAVADMSKKVAELMAILSASATELQVTAEALATAADQTNAQSNAVASASEELTYAVREISQRLAEASGIIETAVTEAGSAEGSIRDLIADAAKISAMSGVVAKIAGQTNLLALNATIEAAHAGELGHGFAIVASEVKTLAKQTASATEEIGQQVHDIQTSSQHTAGGIKSIADTIGRVSEISLSISGAVEQQSAATEEVSRNIHGVKAASEENGRSAANLLTVSREIARRAVELDREFTDFAQAL